MERNTTRSAKVRVLLVDDHPVLRDGLSHFINQKADLCVCGQADGIGKALELIRSSMPDVAVIDLSLKDGSGLDLIKQIKSNYPSIKVLVLSMHDEAVFASRVLRAGAVGYVEKAEPPETIVLAIRAVMQSNVYLSSRISARLLRGMVGGEVTTGSPVELLSDREFEVYELIGRGLGTREISEKLHLSVKTVESHCIHIRTKLGFDNSRELTRHAVLWVGGQS